MAKKRKKGEALTLLGDSIHALLAGMGGSRPRSRLEDLWQRWAEVVGADLAAWVVPLGSHGQVLLLGAEDAMQMQEMHFASQEVLEAANSFLGEEYFTSVRVCLAQDGKSCLPGQTQTEVPKVRPQQAVQEFPSGKYLKSMVKSSPVYACYASFAAKRRKA